MSTTQITQHNVTGVTVERRYYAPADGNAGCYATTLQIDTEHLGALTISMYGATMLHFDAAPASILVEVGT